MLVTTSDKQEYRNSVRDQLTSTIATIKDLKTKLDGQKAETEKLLADQKAQREALAGKEAEQQSILNKTQGDEAAYQQLVSNSQAQIAEARAVQATIYRRGTSTGGYNVFDSGLLSAYVTDSSHGSWNDSNCPISIYVYVFYWFGWKWWR